MCISARPAEFTDTVIYSAEVLNPEGEVRHVIAYQNNVKAVPGPNAMILPIPAEDIGPENIVDTTSFKNFLKDYSGAVKAEIGPPANDSFMLNGDMTKGLRLSRSVTFKSGSYTVALANTAEGLSDALANVPINERPNISEELISSLSELYPGWPIAICCFDGLNAKNPEPVLWQFKPKFDKVLFAPAMDAHDGGAPDLDASVPRDHVLIYSSYKQSNTVYKNIFNKSIAGKYSSIPEEYRWMFNPAVKGSIMKGTIENGDFSVSIDDLLAGGKDITAEITITQGE